MKITFPVSDTKNLMWKDYIALLEGDKVTIIHDSGKHADAKALNALGFPNES